MGTSIGDDDMFRIFNCGIGMVLIVNKEEAPSIMDCIKSDGYDCYKIGYIESKTDASIRYS
jgi:phosphoribosylformylglycinamidine cyclo-ligase